MSDLDNLGACVPGCLGDLDDLLVQGNPGHPGHAGRPGHQGHLDDLDFLGDLENPGELGGLLDLGDLDDLRVLGIWKGQDSSLLLQIGKKLTR